MITITIVMRNRTAPDSPKIMIYKILLIPAVCVVGVTESTNRERDNQVKCCVIYYNYYNILYL